VPENRAGDPGYEPPKLTEHGRLADLTQHTPSVPDALDATLGSGERVGDDPGIAAAGDPADR
jgi:hypothetical protein